MRLSILLVLGIFSSTALSEMIMVPASQDNSLYEVSGGDLSNGAGEFLFSGKTVNFGVRRALVAFKNLDDIPSGVRIDEVKLHMFMSKEDSPETVVRLLRVTSDWGEGSSDAPGQEGAGTAATTGDATWTHRFFNDVPWTSVGGDFSATESAQLPINDIGPYVFGSTAGMVADVQDWLDNPGSNFGWILVAAEDVKSARRFNSREHSNAERRPMLEISYTADTAEPPDPSWDWSGPWFDPTLDGEGYLVYKTPAGWLIFFFGYTTDNEQLWLISDVVPIENLMYGQTYELRMLVGIPGSFTMPSPSTELQVYGTLQIQLNGCQSGVFILDGLDGIKTSNVIKLIGVAGTECIDPK